MDSHNLEIDEKSRPIIAEREGEGTEKRRKAERISACAASTSFLAFASLAFQIT
jgi:hypothetical protein